MPFMLVMYLVLRRRRHGLQRGLDEVIFYDNLVCFSHKFVYLMNSKGGNIEPSSEETA